MDRLSQDQIIRQAIDEELKCQLNLIAANISFDSLSNLQRTTTQSPKHLNWDHSLFIRGHKEYESHQVGHHAISSGFVLMALVSAAMTEEELANPHHWSFCTEMSLNKIKSGVGLCELMEITNSAYKVGVLTKIIQCLATQDPQLSKLLNIFTRPKLDMILTQYNVVEIFEVTNMIFKYINCGDQTDRNIFRRKKNKKSKNAIWIVCCYFLDQSGV